jgi:plasmid stabilization system protein ParE
VPRLVYRKTARRDIAEIAAFIEQESQDRAVAQAFVNKLIHYCEHLARLPGLLGRPRPELGPGYCSTTFGSYVIFLQYTDKDSPRSHLYIVHILHGSRDLDAYFSQHSDDEGTFGLNDENSVCYVAYHP